MRAVATASATARLMPTPPTGDIACAASPMHSTPSEYQRRSRLSCTSSSFTSSNEVNVVDAVGEPGHHARPARGAAPRCLGPRIWASAPFGNDVGDLVVVAAVDHDDPVPGLEACRRGRSGRRAGEATGTTTRPSARRSCAASGPSAERTVDAATVAGHRELGAHLLGFAALVAVGDAATDAARRSRTTPVTSVLRSSWKLGSASAAAGQQLEEVPLRHQRDVLMRAGQVGQVEIHRLALHFHVDRVDQAMRQLGEPRAPGPARRAAASVLAGIVFLRRSRRRSARFSITVTFTPPRASAGQA